MMEKSPLAPEQFPKTGQVAGLSLLALSAGERYQGRDDVLLAVMSQGTQSAAVFTQSLTPGAPVIWSRKIHASGGGHAMIVTAGNANVCTGKQGLVNTQIMAEATAILANTTAEQVFVSSTGVIGEQLKVERITDCLPVNLAQDVDQDWQSAASAIMTTDTYPKAASASVVLGDEIVTISGIAKGSGMIEPNMATMLSYIFTDAAIESEALQTMLDQATQQTFNCITVDSDTSTSDTCLLFATGQAQHAQITKIDSNEGRLFYSALESVMKDLAQQIVRDGEGAQKFISIEISGAQTDDSARVIAKSIANSPLVKTAIAGEDANWGRLVMAIGKAGEPINVDALSISMGGIRIAEGDGPLADYDESLVQKHIEGAEIDIHVDIGLDQGCATVWTCDLTHGYIDINADYRS